MKTIAPTLKAQKNTLAVTNPWVYLIVVQVTDTQALYLTNHSESIVYDGHTYKPFPVAVGDIGEDSKGNLETITLSISNINRMAMAYMELHDALMGRDVWIYIVNTVYLTQAVGLGIFQVTEASADENVATFTLGHYHFFSVKFPRNRYIKGRCRFVFKSVECGYGGGHATCNKTLTGNTSGNPGCKYHNNSSRFGGFPYLVSGRSMTI